MNTEPVRRTTRQRTAVSELLSQSREFKTAQQVHELLRGAGESIGLATVYRALQAMVDAAEVDVLRTEEGELAYRVCSDGHHHHLVCRSCGKTVEIEVPMLEKWAAEMAAEHGFEDVDHDLELYGLCTPCSRG